MPLPTFASDLRNLHMQRPMCRTWLEIVLIPIKRFARCLVASERRWR